MGVVWLALAVGCVAPGEELPDPETSEVEQHLEPCPGCGGNGMRQSEWNYVFSTLDRNALNDHGLWDEGAVSPRSLCKAISGAECVLRDGWHAWLQGATATQRQGIFENLVKIVLPKDQHAWAGGKKLDGKFGLMKYARLSSWGKDGREIASAGLLALLSAVPDVAICLNTRDLPNNCVGSSASHSESVTFGDAIHGSRYIAIWGSVHAPFPARNGRYGTVSPESAAIHNNAYNTCDTEGTGNTRYPVRCRWDGVTWQNAVHVLTPRHPEIWYYDRVPTARPDSWPLPI